MLAHSKNFHQLIFTKISFNLTLTISFRKFSLKIKNILYYEPYVMNFHPGSMNYGHTYSYFKIDDMTPEYWYTFNIAYQLSRELYKNQWKEKDKADIYNRAINDKSFHSTYLDALNGSSGSVINEETCCEYFATMICRSLGMK